MFKQILTILAALIFAWPATAAQIAINPDGIVSIEGEITPGDKQRFANIVFANRVHLVALNSGGGSLGEAIEIGNFIRMKGLTTGVPRGDMCASSCALIWLAGVPRLATSESRIGFHAAYHSNPSGIPEVSSFANAAIGAYLNSLGFSQDAVITFTSASPTQMHWLKAEEAAQLGVDIVFVPTQGDAQPQPQRQASVPTYNSLPQPPSDLKNEAQDFANRYLSEADAEVDPDKAVQRMASTYNDQVLYYGQVKERRDVLREYADLVKRWPVRRYWAQQMTVNCTTADTCVIDAVINWDNSSQPRNARSTGTATLYLVVRQQGDGGFMIDVINGEVKSRLVSKLTPQPQPQPCLFGVLCLNAGN